jgi:hypothetical protein
MSFKNDSGCKSSTTLASAKSLSESISIAWDKCYIKKRKKLIASSSHQIIVKKQWERTTSK